MRLERGRFLARLYRGIRAAREFPAAAVAECQCRGNSLDVPATCGANSPGISAHGALVGVDYPVRRWHLDANKSYAWRAIGLVLYTVGMRLK